MNIDEMLTHIRELEARAERAESEQLKQARLLGMSAERELAMLSRAEKAKANNKQLRDVVKMLLSWAGKKCPCENETPDPCPLCGASIVNLKPCMAAENTIPLDILRNARAAMEAADEQ